MKRFFSIFCSFILCSCASVMEGSIQPIHVETPGAENAQCYIESDERRYAVNPPQTIKISRSPDTLTVHCFAPGNREQSMQIEPVAVDAIMLNIGTALLPGLLYDHASGAMYEYPEMVSVDFRGIPTEPMPWPQRYSKDIDPPMVSGLEEFRAGYPQLSDDAGQLPVKIKRRGFESADEASALPVDVGGVPLADIVFDAESLGAAFDDSAPPSLPQESTPGKKMSREDLTRRYNPGVFTESDTVSTGNVSPYSEDRGGSGPANSIPLELFTGE